MCGIFGYTGLISKENADNFKNLLIALFNASELRGTHASGFAARYDDGAIVYDKLPYRGSVFSALSTKFNSLINKEELPTSFIAHTRYGTGSSPRVANNNHPFVGNNYIAVHNGTISGWRELAKKYNVEDKFESETDSELIIRLIDKLQDESPNVKIQYHIGWILNNVWGNMAVALLDKFSSKIYLYRNENPLNVFSFAPGTLGPEEVNIFCSTAEIMNAAWKASSFTTKLKKLTSPTMLPINKPHLISKDKYKVVAGEEYNFIVYNDVHVSKPFYRQTGYNGSWYNSYDYNNKVTTSVKNFDTVALLPSRPDIGLSLAEKDISEIRDRIANGNSVFTTIDNLNIDFHIGLTRCANQIMLLDYKLCRNKNAVLVSAPESELLKATTRELAE